MDTTPLSEECKQSPLSLPASRTRHKVLKLQKSEDKFHTLLNQQVLSKLLETRSMYFGAQMDIC